MMIRNKQPQSNTATEQLAKAIAFNIIKWQSALASRLNARINRLSGARQKWLLFAFCAVSTAGLILCLIIPYGKNAINIVGNSYQPTHIGLPSGQPQPTDSLTIKK
ncbi:MAG: hypothetical protein WC615_00320 [Mucilaginibacter sp.]|jgi:hypothetical protein|uniref:hypothetical protein n=1 Tax=Mucilaginibacter sp. TaxID=1882438 RepID=UPI00356A726D